MKRDKKVAPLKELSLDLFIKNSPSIYDACDLFEPSIKFPLDLLNGEYSLHEVGRVVLMRLVALQVLESRAGRDPLANTNAPMTSKARI